MPTDERPLDDSLDTAEDLLGRANDRAIDLAMQALARGTDLARAALVAAEGFAGKGMAVDALAFYELFDAHCLAEAPVSTPVLRSGETSATDPLQTLRVRAALGRARLRSARGEDTAATEELWRAVTIAPRSGAANLALGQDLASRAGDEPGAAEKALACFAIALEDESTRARALFSRALLLAETKRKKDARRDLLAAAEAGHADAAGHLAEDGADVGAWSGPMLVTLARYYRELEDPDFDSEAATLELAIPKLEGEEKHDALLSLGWTQRYTEAFGAAVKTLEKAEKLAPSGRAGGDIARTLYLADKNRKAEAKAKKVIASGAAPFEAHRTLGEIAFEEENYEEAVAAYDEAAKYVPAHMVAPVQLARGRALMELDRTDEARVAFLAAEDAGSDEARDERRAHFGSETAGDFFDDGLACLDDGDWEGAVEPLERAATAFREQTKAPGDFAARQLANVLTNLGNAARQRGDFAAAIACLEEATRARPTGYEALVMFANIVRNANALGDTPVDVEGKTLRGPKDRLLASIGIYDRAVALAQGVPYAHYNRGLARQTNGQWREANEDFERALAYEEPSQRQDAVFNLVKSAWKAAAFDDARRWCDALVTGEDLETATMRNIEALVRRRPAYEGDALLARFSQALDTIARLQDEAKTAKKPTEDRHPFRFYGVRPEAWEPGGNMGHRYRLRFREAPDAETRAKIAEAVGRPKIFVDDGEGSTWRWSGPFVALTIGETDITEFDAFFEEVADMMKAIHAVAPLDEVVALNAQSLSRGDASIEAWERWSLTIAPLPSAHPFTDDGALFFSAYGEVGAWPTPSEDPEFHEARLAFREE